MSSFEGHSSVSRPWNSSPSSKGIPPNLQSDLRQKYWCFVTLTIQWCSVAPGIFSRIFGGLARADGEIVSGERLQRRSTGFNEFMNRSHAKKG